MVLGCHGDDMVPLVSMTTVGGKKITEIVPAEVIDRLVKRTQNRGAEVVGLLKTGSAYYSPSAGVIEILEAMTGDTGAELSVSAFLDGEYGIKDCFLSVPSKITKNGIERVLEYTVSDSEKASLAESAARVKKLIGVLPR
jgi:malate dehydrogenase